MDAVSRGRGFSGALRYIFANFKASWLYSSNVLAARDAARSSSKMQALWKHLRPDIRRPVWHQALRLPKGEVISHDKFRAIACEYMRRMGWDEDQHQYVVIVSDDPVGQHVHIVANRVATSGAVYYGRNENLISTRICQELEREFNLNVTKGPEYRLDARGIARLATAPSKERKLKKNEMHMGERLAREGNIRPMPRRALQRILKSALAAGVRDGLSAFLSQVEGADVRVIANLASTGRANGLSFEVDGIAFKGSAVGDDYSWSKLAAAVGFDSERDQALLEARSRRHGFSRDDVHQDTRHLGPPVPPVPDALNPIVVPAHAHQEEYHYDRSYRPTYQAARSSTVADDSLARAPSLDCLRPLSRSHVGSDGEWGAGTASTQSVLPRDSDGQLGSSVEPGGRLRPIARVVEETAVSSSEPVERPLNPRAQSDADFNATARRLYVSSRYGLERDDTQEVAKPELPPNLRRLEQQVLGGVSYFVKRLEWSVIYLSREDEMVFIDSGKRIRMPKSTDDSIRGSLELALSRWPQVRVKGPRDFLLKVAHLAVRLGIEERIGNPELKPVMDSLKAIERVIESPVPKRVVETQMAPAVSTQVSRRNRRMRT